jgi:hypothetical protein
LYSNIFDWIVGFTQLDFYPHIASPFLQKLAIKVFLEKYDMEFIIGNLLVEEQNLGRNTDVAVMNGEKGWRFFLCSESRSRPLGITVSPQCPACGRLGSSEWGSHPNDQFTLLVNCKFCPHIYSLYAGQDDYFTKAILNGGEGWGIGLYWGPYIDHFPNGAEAYSRGSQSEEVTNRLKAIGSQEHYKKLAEKKAAEKSGGQAQELAHAINKGFQS